MVSKAQNNLKIRFNFFKMKNKILKFKQNNILINNFKIKYFYNYGNMSNNLKLNSVGTFDLQKFEVINLNTIKFANRQTFKIKQSDCFKKDKEYYHNVPNFSDYLGILGKSKKFKNLKKKEIISKKLKKKLKCFLLKRKINYKFNFILNCIDFFKYKKLILGFRKFFTKKNKKNIYKRWVLSASVVRKITISKNNLTKKKIKFKYKYNFFKGKIKNKLRKKLRKYRRKISRRVRRNLRFFISKRIFWFRLKKKAFVRLGFRQ